MPKAERISRAPPSSSEGTCTRATLDMHVIPSMRATHTSRPQSFPGRDRLENHTPGKPWRCWGGLAQRGNACEGRHLPGGRLGLGNRTERNPADTDTDDCKGTGGFDEDAIRRAVRTDEELAGIDAGTSRGRSSTGRAPGCGPGGAGSNPAGHSSGCAEHFPRAPVTAPTEAISGLARGKLEAGGARESARAPHSGPPSSNGQDGSPSSCRSGFNSPWRYLRDEVLNGCTPALGAGGGGSSPPIPTLRT
jgi:hypothetical protein